MFQSYVMFKSNNKDIEFLEDTILENSLGAVKHLMTLYDENSVIARFVTNNQGEFLECIDKIEGSGPPGFNAQILYTGG